MDVVRHLDRGSAAEPIEGRNPARAFIGHSSGDGFATAPDLIRFAHALRDGTLLSRPCAGCGADWTVCPDTGWIGVLLSNYDDFPVVGVLQLQEQVITGWDSTPPGGG